MTQYVTYFLFTCIESRMHRMHSFILNYVHKWLQIIYQINMQRVDLSGRDWWWVLDICAHTQNLGVKEYENLNENTNFWFIVPIIARTIICLYPKWFINKDLKCKLTNIHFLVRHIIFKSSIHFAISSQWNYQSHEIWQFSSHICMYS